jgi:hypothetical protein
MAAWLFGWWAAFPWLRGNPRAMKHAHACTSCQLMALFIRAVAHQASMSMYKVGGSTLEPHRFNAWCRAAPTDQSHHAGVGSALSEAPELDLTISGHWYLLVLIVRPFARLASIFHGLTLTSRYPQASSVQAHSDQWRSVA